MQFIEFITQSSIAFVAVAAAIVGVLVQFLKIIGLNSKFAPLMALVLGVTIGVCYGQFGVSYNVLAGVLAGATASGIYSGVKRTME